MASSIWNYLTAPSLPRTTLALTSSHVALLEMQKRSGEFTPKKLGVQSLPTGLIQTSLTEPNVTREADFVSLLSATAQQAGFNRRLKLSVTLPEGSAHASVVTLESTPGSRAEVEQMLTWKIGRATNLKATDVKTTFQSLSPLGGQPRWLVAAVHKDVLAQYERLFAQLGWQAGVVLPQHIGEAQWLLRGNVEAQEDQVMVSVNPTGFVVVVVRGHEPLLIREVVCSPAEREDELFRLMIFYRDRLAPTQPVKRLLIIGEPNEQAPFAQALTAALEQTPQKLAPLSLGLSLEANAPFHRLAAAAGLATLAF
ncbi:MAG: hypothetical protein U0Y68_19570 [Blastocatellia bacterium]